MSNQEKKQDPSNERNTKNEIENIISSISIFKSLKTESLKKLVNHCKLVQYKIGQPICDSSIIPSKIFLILKGEARLLIQDGDRSSSILKIGTGSFIGLGSLLRVSACEDVAASEPTTVLSIPDELIVSLYETENEFKKWCLHNLQPCEIVNLLEKLIKNSNRTDINIKTAFNILIKNTRLKVVEKSLRISTDEKNTLIIGSQNVEGAKIGDIITGNKSITPIIPFAARLLEIPTYIYNEFINIKTAEINNLVNNSTEDNNSSIDIEQGSIVEKSGLDFTENKSKKQLKLIKAQGKLQETIACLQMITSLLDVPFRKDSIEKIIRDELRIGNQISIDTCGKITSITGLYSVKAQIPINLASRLPTPSLISWNNSFAVIFRCNANSITIASPNEGIIDLNSDKIQKIFGEKIEMLIVEKSNLTPNKNFNLNWFLPSLKKYKNSLFLVLLASFVVQLFGLANPLLIQVIIDKVISQRSLDTLQVLGFALVIVTILGGILGSLRTYLFTETTNRIDTRLGAEVIDHLLRLPLNYFDKRPVGELGSRVAELEKIREFLTGQALSTLLDAIFSIIYIIVMFLYSSLLSFVALSVIPIQIILTLLGSPLLRRQIREIAKQNASTQSHLIEVLTGVQTVKAQNIETVSRWKWQELYVGYISRTFEKIITSTALNQTSTVLQQLSQLMVLWIGASLVLAGKLTLGQLIAFRIISGYVTQPLLRLSSIWQSIQQLKVSFERLADIIDTPEESTESDKANIPLPPIQGDVNFENVSFAFQKGSPDIIKNINLKIKQGTFIGIAGQSGSGKSTLMKLLPRLYNIDKGRILIDTYDISKTELYSLRRQIGIVPQEPLLFSGSISENIAVTNPEVSSEEIVSAAKKAAAHDFIMELPQGYSTNVGERGSGLSGGQKQRIAIARTLISNPKLLIMDEATSALDYQTENTVCENLRLTSSGTTVFFITHRLSTIKNADQIVMMHEGRVVETGSHDELISKKGRYYALYRKQEGTQ